MVSTWGLLVVVGSGEDHSGPPPMLTRSTPLACAPDGALHHDEGKAVGRAGASPGSPPCGFGPPLFGRLQGPDRPCSILPEKTLQQDRMLTSERHA